MLILMQYSKLTLTGNLTRAESTRMYVIVGEAKKTVLDFSKETVKVAWFYFVLIQYYYKITTYNTLNVKISVSLTSIMVLFVFNFFRKILVLFMSFFNKFFFVVLFCLFLLQKDFGTFHELF